MFRGSWHGQAVAVKKARIAASADLDRFKAELAILARLRHPAVVPLLGRWGGRESGAAGEVGGNSKQYTQ